MTEDAIMIAIGLLFGVACRPVSRWVVGIVRVVRTAKVGSMLAHMARVSIGRDPHRWQPVDHLSGIEKAASKASVGDAMFYGSGSMTRTWKCACGQTTDLEPL